MSSIKLINKAKGQYHSICPLIQDKCIAIHCKWFIDHDFPFHDNCSLPLLGELAIMLGIKGRKNWHFGYERKGKK